MPSSEPIDVLLQRPESAPPLSPLPFDMLSSSTLQQRHPRPPTPPTPPVSASISSTSSPEPLSPTSPQDADSVSRPSLYRHEPIPRPAPFEQYYGHTLHGVKILEELKSDRLEGVYNLSFLLLAFALAYLCVRNVIEMGFLAGPSALCLPILLRDMYVLMCFCIPLPVLSTSSFALVSLYAARIVSPRVIVALHGVSLALLLYGATRALFHMALNPLLGVAAGVFVVVIALKMHSYVMTNLLLAEETEERRKQRRERAARRPSAQRVQRVQRAKSAQDGLRIGSGVAAMDGVTNSSTTSSSGSSGDRVAVTRVRGATSGRANRVAYPRNVRLGNWAYFMVAPTLVYETGYPRSEGIRLRYIAWHGFQAVVCGVVQYVLVMQFCVPVWRTSAPTDQLWWFSIKLALPCFFTWLLLFWGFFHCVLNLLAEVTRFADRLFYREWWNATDLSQFWRMWNMPVHEWCLRHLYVETVTRGQLNARAAALGTFLLSAVFHEYVCVVGFRLFRPYMFVGMMLQVPLIEWSTGLGGTRRGNFFMWIMLFLSQSWVPLLYCRDYLFANGALMCRS